MSGVDDALDRLERALRYYEDWSVEFASVRDELQRLRDERDEWERRCKLEYKVRSQARDYYEERVRQLEDGLREIENLHGGYPDDYCAKARALLAADSPPDDGPNMIGLDEANDMLTDYQDRKRT